MHGGNCFSQRRRAGSVVRSPVGFTLIELLVTISVAAILIALGTPSFIAIVNSNRLAAQSNEVVAALQLARVEAVRQNRRAIVCGSTNGTTCNGVSTAWNTGWITFLDMDGNGAPAAAEVIRVSTVKAPLQVRSGVASISFRSDGMAHDSANDSLVNTTVTVCIPTARPVMNQRVVGLGSGSRISTASANGAGACP
ncbi:MAG: GspH/FimT family pseudopilin [Pseudoxanthomonas sp.]